MQSQIQTIPARQRQLITTYAASAYFADAYGLSLKGALQKPSTEVNLQPVG